MKVGRTSGARSIWTGALIRLSIRSMAKPTSATRSDIGRVTRSSSTAPATTNGLGWTSGDILTRISCTSSKRSRGQTKAHCITKPRSMIRAPTPDPGRLRGIFHGLHDKNSLNTCARRTTFGFKACMMISENRFFIGRRRNPGAESNAHEHCRTRGFCSSAAFRCSQDSALEAEAAILKSNLPSLRNLLKTSSLPPQHDYRIEAGCPGRGDIGGSQADSHEQRAHEYERSRIVRLQSEKHCMQGAAESECGNCTEQRSDGEQKHGFREHL